MMLSFPASRQMPPKTQAEIQRVYRKRKKEREGVKKQPPKERKQIQLAYRLRKKLESKEKYLKAERDRKRKAYIPTSSLSTDDQNQRRAVGRVNAKRFWEKNDSGKITALIKFH